MTEAEHKKQTTLMKSRITRAKTVASKIGPLQEKLKAMRAITAMEDALREHKLNFFELTSRN